MNRREARALLDRSGISRRCDLDLLVFLARHPRSFLASETLARFLGYGLEEVAEALEALRAAGLLERRQTAAHAARMYIFVGEGDGDGWLPPLLRMASTRPGRLALQQALPVASGAGGPGGEGRAVDRGTGKTGPVGLVAPPEPARGRGGKAG